MRVVRLLIACLLGLAFCGLLVTAEEKITIRFLHSVRAPLSEHVEELADDFMAENDHIAVVTEYGGHFGDVELKVRTGIAAGHPPTVAHLYDSSIPSIISDLVPLSEYISDEIEDIIPGLLRSVTSKGVVYGIPWSRSVMILFYRKDLIKKPPATWQEFFDLAAELTVDLDGDGQIDRWGTVLRPSDTGIFLNFLYQASGALFDADWLAVTVDDEKGFQAMSHLASLIPYALIGDNYESTYLEEDLICMFVSSSSGARFNEQAAEKLGVELGYAPAPTNEATGRSGTLSQGGNLVVLRSGQTEDQRQAGIEFVRFMMQPENLASFCIHGGYVPTTEAALADESWVDACAKDDAMTVMTEAIKSAFSLLGHPKYDEIHTTLRSHLEGFIAGGSLFKEEGDVKHVLGDLAEDLSWFLKE